MSSDSRYSAANTLTFHRILFLLLGIFLLFSGMQLKASAAPSVNDIQSVSGGSFYKTGKYWRYRQQDGTILKDCLAKIDGKIYYFSAKGNRQSGWKKLSGSYYYFGTSSQGYMYQLKWLKTKNGTYFLKKSGKRAVGWMTWQGKTYYFNSAGKRLSGWQVIGGKKYYLGTSAQGWRYQNRLFTYKNRIFYLQKDGSAATGWKTISGKKYFFDKNGRAYKGKHTIGKTDYYFSSKGVLLHSGTNLSLSSDCAILIQADTGKVIYAKNETVRHANASTTKILTCILALENASMTDKVTVSENAASQEPTKLYMNAGDSFYMKDLLYSLMLPSHNDTAVAIAEHISGSTGEFVKLMNQKAKSIGCTNTRFATPNGLDAGYTHYTTASDLAKIASYAWKNSTFRKIVKTSSYSFRSIKGSSYTVTTTNSLLGSLPGVNGMKTGYTNKAGYCFVGTVKAKNGKTYISVVLGGSTSTMRWNDSSTLLKYAYSLK